MSTMFTKMKKKAAEFAQESKSQGLKHKNADIQYIIFFTTLVFIL